jgi:hypothetical protein
MGERRHAASGRHVITGAGGVIPPPALAERRRTVARGRLQKVTGKE